MLVGGVVCSAAFYCRRCGRIHVHDVPYFLGERQFSLRCAACGHEQAVLVRQGKKHWEIHVPCVACGKTHVLRGSLAQLRRMELEKVYCSKDRFELGYIGQRRQILLEAINRVHEFVAAGEVACPCGSHDFIAQVDGNSVLLVCSHCGSYAVLPAESADDLARLACGFDIGFLAAAAHNKR